MIHKILFTIAFLAISHSQFSQTYNWANLPAAPTNGSKQDGIYFVNKDTGWVVNGSGKIFRTQNGGTTWLQQKNSAGTYFRSVAFMDAQTGFAGNVGINYFPGVTDTNPLYKTTDGGNSWVSVTSNISGVVPAGICAIQVVNSNVIYAAGRVGSPATIIKSIDGGNTWTGINLTPYCKMVMDVYFHSADTGYVFAGTDANIAVANASILRTTDGGLTWTNVYTSQRPYEIMWKAWFPSHNVGYGTVQSYNTNTTQRYVVKTTDGGLTWTELPLVNTGIREFGVGFINDTVGWVGGETTGYETKNGGLTWANKSIGQYANKFSIVKNPGGGNTCYAVGLNVFKMSVNTSTAVNTTDIKNESKKSDRRYVYPNPAISGGYISMSLENIPFKIIKSELISLVGKKTYTLFDSFYSGTRESPFEFKLPEVPSGQYILKFTDEYKKTYTQSLIIN